MPLTFHPGPGAILICDFSTGFRAPEMVKVRPVIVVSPRRRVGHLATIVPLSSTPPAPREPWHYPLPPGVDPPARCTIWAKCDMVATVALDRLDRVKLRDKTGARSYQMFQAPPEVLAAIRDCVRAALGIA